MAGEVLRNVTRGLISFGTKKPLTQLDTEAANRDFAQARAALLELEVARREGDIARAQELEGILRQLGITPSSGQTTNGGRSDGCILCMGFGEPSS